MPTRKHFFRRQYWHWFLWCWSIWHSLFDLRITPQKSQLMKNKSLNICQLYLIVWKNEVGLMSSHVRRKRNNSAAHAAEQHYRCVKLINICPTCHLLHTAFTCIKIHRPHCPVKQLITVSFTAGISLCDMWSKAAKPDDKCKNKPHTASGKAALLWCAAIIFLSKRTNKKQKIWWA